jgi:hypothetical protein
MAKVADAEAAAHKYVREVPHMSEQMRNFAYEDFVAGFTASADETELRHKLDFVRDQLVQLADIASRESEFYSLAVVRYMQEMLK